MPDDGIQQVRHNSHSVHCRRHKKILRLPGGNPSVAFPPLLHQHETDLEFHPAGIAVVVQQFKRVSQDRPPGEYGCRTALLELAPQVAGQEMRAALDFAQLKPGPGEGTPALRARLFVGHAYREARLGELAKPGAVNRPQDGPPPAKRRRGAPPLKIIHPPLIQWVRPVVVEVRRQPHVFHDLKHAHQDRKGLLFFVEVRVRPERWRRSA